MLDTTRSANNSTLKASPVQLVQDRYILLNIKFIADWETIRLRKQTDVNKNIACEKVSALTMIIR